MQLVEILLHGVAGHPPQARLQLAPGHIVLRSAEPLLPLIRSVLFHDGSHDDETAALASTPDARVALVLRGRDGATWRLVRQLRGGCTLQRLDEAAGRFVPVEAGPGELLPILRTQIGVPPRRAFEALCTFDARLLATPTLREERAPEAVPIAAAETAATPPDRAALERGIARLEQELEAAERVDLLQQRLDELLHDQAAVQRELDGVKEAEGRVAASRAELPGFDDLADLPDDLGAEVLAWRTAEADRDAALQRIEADRLARESRAPAELPPPIWKDRRFLAACGLGLAALGVALYSPLRVIALLDLPAFGVAAALGLRWVGQLQAADASTRMGLLFDERARKTHARWEAASSPLRQELERLGLRRPEELQERVGARAQARRRLAEAEAELEAVRVAHEAAYARQAALRRDATAIEEQLSVIGAAAYRNRAAVQAELDGLLAQRDGRSREARPGLLVGAGMPLGLGRPAAEPGPRADPCIELLEHAAELLAADRHEIGGRVELRVGQYLAALADRRHEAVELSSVSGMVCKGPAGAIPFNELPGVDRALAWLALQLTLIEQIAGRQPIPVVYEESFGFLAEAQQRLLARILQGLGRRTQVIHRTGAAAFLDHADAIVELR